MSDQDKESGETGTEGSSVVVLEPSASNRLNNPYCLTELHEVASHESYHKTSVVPIVPCITTISTHLGVTEELKIIINPDNTELKACESAMSSEKVTTNHSSNIRKRESSPEVLKMVDLDSKKGTSTPSPQPIPAQPTQSVISSPRAQKAEKKGDDDSITDEIAEIGLPALKTTTEWSDEEEAGGLPRSESRASRISRAMRQLLCCGLRYQTPSEGDTSTPRGYASGI